MKKLDQLSVMVTAKALICLLYGVAIPLIFWFSTNSSLPLYLLLLLVISVTVIHVSKTLSRGLLTIFLGMVSALTTAIFGLSVLIGIVVTPFSAYDLWFEAMNEGTGTGTVSNLFTLLSAFFSTTLGVTFISIGYLWPLLIAGLYISALFSIIFQIATLYALTFTICLACLLYLVLCGSGSTHPIRRTFYSIILFFVVVLSAILLSGGHTATGSQVVDTRLHPKLRQYVSNNFPQFPLLYGIPGYGYSFQERSLGGSPILSPLPIFNISANVDGPLYLKTDIFDFYDGKSWKTSFTRSDSLQEPQSIMLQGHPASTSYPTLVQAARENKTIRVELLIDFYNKLPYTLNTRRFYFESAVPKIDNGHFHSGFHLSNPLVAGAVFFIDQDQESVVLNRNQTGSLELSAADRRRYLQLPPSISANVRKIAANFRDPSVPLSQRLDNIVNHLSGTYVYSLNVEDLRRSENFLEKFLMEERKGYCVHFATAFAIIARLVGIPTRYNTGFLVNFPNGENETDVTGLAAHSWPEVWIDGKGWIQWEATSVVSTPSHTDFLTDEDFWANSRFEMETDDYTVRQVQSILGGRDLNVTPQATSINPFKGNRPLTLQIIRFLLTAIIATMTIWRLGYYLRIRRQSRELQLPIALFKRYILLGRSLGIQNPNRTGWATWGRSIQQNLRQRNPATQRLTNRLIMIVSRGVYGQQIISNRDMNFIRKLYWRLLGYRLFKMNSLRHSDNTKFWNGTK